MARFSIVSPKEIWDVSGSGGPTAGTMSGALYALVNSSTTGGAAVTYVPDHWKYVSVHIVCASTSGSGDAVFQGGKYGVAQQDPVVASFSGAYEFQNVKLADHIETGAVDGLNDIRGISVQIARIGGDDLDTLGATVAVAAIIIRNSDSE